MGDYGLKISKAGYAVKTAAIKDQIFNSTANSLKIFAKGSANITTTSWGIATVQITHNLNYIPYFLTYYKLKDGNKVWFQDSTDTSRLLANYNYGYTTADTTKLYCNVFSDEAASYTAVVYYVIFIDKSYA